jgi:transcriptional regulator with XRE-family HTH domain
MGAMAAAHNGADALDLATHAFVDAVKEAAEANLVSRKRIALILGIGQSTLANWFNNYAPPDLERLHNSNAISVNKRLDELEIACEVITGTFVGLYRDVTSARAHRRLAKASPAESDPYNGVSKVFNSFPVNHFCSLMSDATQIRLLNTWYPNLHHLEDQLKGAIARECDIELTMLNPYCTAAIARASTLGYKPGREPLYSIAGEIRESLRRIASLSHDFDYPSHLKVYLYPEIPALAVYQADDYSLAGLFLHGRLAVDGPQLEVSSRGSFMAAVINDELDKVRDGSIGPVDLAHWESWLNSNL